MNTFYLTKEFRSYKGQIFVIKIGGSILENPKNTISFVHDLKRLRDAGIQTVLIHGGGKAINQKLDDNQLDSVFIDGLRVTSRDAIYIIKDTLKEINSMIVNHLNQSGLNAIGLSDIENGMLRCKQYSKTHGFVGKIDKVETSVLTHFLQQQYTPVVAPLGFDSHFELMNINADEAASGIAVALKANKLIYLTDQDGIYDKDGSVYPSLNNYDLNELVENKTVVDGMLIKTKSIISALKSHISEVHIINGNHQQPLVNIISKKHSKGTFCYLEEDIA